jgi:hypothetical protein
VLFEITLRTVGVVEDQTEQFDGAQKLTPMRQDTSIYGNREQAIRGPSETLAGGRKQCRKGT